MEVVFTNYDILYNILTKLDIFTLNAIASVSKLFYKINDNVYDIQLKSNIIQPANIIFNNYKLLIQPTIDLININNNNIVDNFYRLISDDDFRILSNNINNLLESFLNTTLWIALVNDYVLMENIFYHLANIDIFLKYIKDCKFYNIDEYLDNLLTKNLKKIKQYLYVENFFFYDVKSLKILCKFKNIKNYYKLKRFYLVKALTRPKNEVYYLET